MGTRSGERESWTNSLTLRSVIFIASGIAQTRKLKNSLLQIPVRALIKAASYKIWDKPPKAVKIEHFQKDIFSLSIFIELFPLRLLC